MRLPFLSSNGVRDVSGQVKSTLRNQFKVSPGLTGRLRLVSQKGKYQNRRVQFLRIFDPAVIPDHGVSIGKYEDLDSHQHAILFEGHLDKSGFPFIFIIDPSRLTASENLGGTAAQPASELEKAAS